MERFQRIYKQGTIEVMEIWVDTYTGVQYLFRRSGYAGGFTPLLDGQGKPLTASQFSAGCAAAPCPDEAGRDTK